MELSGVVMSVISDKYYRAVRGGEAFDQKQLFSLTRLYFHCSDCDSSLFCFICGLWKRKSAAVGTILFNSYFGSHTDFIYLSREIRVKASNFELS